MKRYKATTIVNFRSGPGTEFDVEGQLAAGEIVQVVDDLTGWLPVMVEDEDGLRSIAWVSAKYLKLAGDDEVEEAPPKSITGKAIVAKAMTQSGDPYIFGYEVDLKNSDPDAFDCSELVQWACAQLGVIPVMPDGSANQLVHCRKHGTTVSVERAVRTAGALLFRPGHVVISRGDGSTIEAKGSAYGVGVFSTSGRGWTAGALIPGVVYE